MNINSALRPEADFRWVKLSAVLLLCFAGVALYAFLSREPHYQGKSLGQWLTQLDDHSALNGIAWTALPLKTTKQQEAADAIRAMGPSAIPRLLHDLSAGNSPLAELWQKAIHFALEKVRRGPSASLGIEAASREERRRWKAALALDALGPAAQTIMPQITALARGQPNNLVCKDAAFVLAGMGVQGLAALTNFPPSNNAWPQLCAIWAIGQHPQSATNLVRWLLGRAKRAPTNPDVFGMGEIWALGQIHTEGSEVIPFLLQELNDTNSFRANANRSAAIESLGKYGKEASNAIPAINAMKANPNFKFVVEQALQRMKSDTP